MGKIGEGVNTLTHPFGVDLFRGGTLSDDTADKLTEQAREANQQAANQWNWLADYGKQFLSVPSAGGMQTSGGTTGSSLDGRRQSAGSAAPVQDTSLADVMGRYMASLDAASSGNGAIDYTLNPTQAEFLNQTLGKVNVQRARAISAAKESLARRGITSGDVYDATLRRISDHYDQSVLETGTQYALQAREQRMSDAYRYLAQLASQVGLGSGLMAQGLSGGQANRNYSAQEAAQLQAHAEQQGQNFMGALMYAFPNAFTLPGGEMLPQGTDPFDGSYGGGYGGGGWGGGRPGGGGVRRPTWRQSPALPFIRGGP